MLHPEPENTAHEQHSAVTEAPLRIHGPQWRYLGDRAAADAAYCIRFGVPQAPEPWSMPSSVWSYTLPPVQPSP